MPIVSDKYRGMREYHLVFSQLIGAARYKGTVTYKQLAQVVGLPPAGSHMGAKLGALLGAISEDETSHARPMLSAIAISERGKPGSGFFGLARELGKLKDNSANAEKRFWEDEKESVYKEWARP